MLHVRFFLPSPCHGTKQSQKIKLLIKKYYSEGITGRALPNGVATIGGPAGMTVGLCLAACQTAGYALAGIEYGEECCMFSTLPSTIVILIYICRVW